MRANAQTHSNLPVHGSAPTYTKINTSEKNSAGVYFFLRLKNALSLSYVSVSNHMNECLLPRSTRSTMDSGFDVLMLLATFVVVDASTWLTPHPPHPPARGVRMG